MASWKDKLNFMAPKGTTVTIKDKEWVFYPISVEKMFKLRPLVAPIVDACAVLFSKNPNDVKQDIEEIKGGKEMDGGTIIRTAVSDIDVKLAQYRNTQRTAALEKAMETIFSDKCRMALAELLCDSLRDDFPSRPTPPSEQEAFINAIDLATLVEFMQGFIKANAEVFGPLGRRAVGAARSKAGDLVDLASKE